MGSARVLLLSAALVACSAPVGVAPSFAQHLPAVEPPPEVIPDPALGPVEAAVPAVLDFLQGCCGARREFLAERDATGSTIDFAEALQAVDDIARARRGALVSVGALRVVDGGLMATCTFSEVHEGSPCSYQYTLELRRDGDAEVFRLERVVQVTISCALLRLDPPVLYDAEAMWQAAGSVGYPPPPAKRDGH